MILQSLVQCYEALERKGKVTKQGWCTAKVSYALEIDKNGSLVGVIPLKIMEQRGKKEVEVPCSMQVPEMVTRSSGVAANFLCDNSSYILGVDNKGKPKRSLECFACAGQKHKAILGHLEEETAQAVIAYFENWIPQSAEDHPLLAEFFEDIVGGANLVFYYKGKYIHENEMVKRAWDTYRKTQRTGEEGICLVTGQHAQIARTHSTIKGIRGAQSSGAALISFNAPSFESYGKEQSFNAPVSDYAVYAYTTALNYMVRNPEYCSVLGDSTVVYWAEDHCEEYQNIFQMAMNPGVDTGDLLNGVFRNLELGKAIDIEGIESSLSLSKKFYILGISPNAARLSVRFFYEDSFGNILKHIKRHYDEMEVVRPASDRFIYLGLWRMLQETVNQKSKDKNPHPNLTSAVFQSILSGTRYPAVLYQAVLGRIRAEQDNRENHSYKITRGRAAIIKAYLSRNSSDLRIKEGLTVGLNEENDQAAYVLGRVFAVLEAIQEDANPGINATIKDRYFNSACASPASIFPVLFKLKNSHTKKLEKRKQIFYEKLLGNLQDKILISDSQTVGYPRRLSLEEQGLFIVGYYHQTQKRFEKKEKEEA